MGILSDIFGSSETISKGFDLIDSIHNSDVELITAKTKAKTDLLTSYAPFKIAQRYLALMFGGTYILSYIVVIVMTFVGQDTHEIQSVLDEFQIDWIMLSIVMFYFGGGLADSIKGNKESK
tara:strand:+ start:257 stop:619 length:363 start_codon:yes stop_codon:yes gene_type:complete